MKTQSSETTNTCISKTPSRSAWATQISERTVVGKDLRVTGFNQNPRLQTPQGTHHWSSEATFISIYAFAYWPVHRSPNSPEINIHHFYKSQHWDPWLGPASVYRLRPHKLELFSTGQVSLRPPVGCREQPTRSLLPEPFPPPPPPAPPRRGLPGGLGTVNVLSLGPPGRPHSHGSYGLQTRLVQLRDGIEHPFEFHDLQCKRHARLREAAWGGAAREHERPTAAARGQERGLLTRISPSPRTGAAKPSRWMPRAGSVARRQIVKRTKCVNLDFSIVASCPPLD